MGIRKHMDGNKFPGRVVLKRRKYSFSQFLNFLKGLKLLKKCLKILSALLILFALIDCKSARGKIAREIQNSIFQN